MSFVECRDGASRYYELIRGDEDKPVLVFLHEGLGCAAMWKNFPAALCESTGCQGLIYDRLGYGKSEAFTTPRTIHYLHEAALFELPALIESLIPKRDYILLGHSDGGSIALIHAAAKVNHLCGVVTEAAHVSVEAKALAGIRSAVDAFQRGELRGLKKYHGDKTDDVFYAWADIWQAPSFIHWNIEYLLPAIDVPLLVAQGEFDEYGTEAQVDSIVRQCAGKTEKLLIDNCGHTPHHETSDLVIDAFTAWISKLTK